MSTLSARFIQLFPKSLHPRKTTDHDAFLLDKIKQLLFKNTKRLAAQHKGNPA
ncbi:MAG: hypothetical protein VXY77_00165 [Pseudomonadota bacterium]|nr:hypothetical protein [Pseudomonadota bacterium]